MKKMKRMLNVLFREGLWTFIYLVKTNLRVKWPAEKKYKKWIRFYENKPEEEALDSIQPPFFSILIVGEGNTDISRASLKRQKYEKFEILEEKEEFSWQDNLDRARGEYVGILYAGDQLSPNALQDIARKIVEDPGREKQLLYTDEDIMGSDGKRKQPFFKPDYSPDTLRSFFYMGGFLMFGHRLAQRLCYAGGQPLVYGGYLLALEASFLIDAANVLHISKVLYHRQEGAARPDAKALGEAKERLFLQYGIAADAEVVKDCAQARMVYRLEQRPQVSIIIPSKDNPQLLEMCLNSICAYTRYKNYEIVVIDNGSSPENRQRYDSLCRVQNVSCNYYYEPVEFNFSYMCNIGAQQASGEYYLFLNDDIQILPVQGYDWLERMLGQAMQPHTGAVGAKLLYPQSGRIQHIGVVNYESGAAHILSKAEDNVPLLFGRNRLDYNYSIVTGACLMVSREKFWKVQGFSELLAVTFNDVELCFKLLEAGYYNVVRNDVVLYHHESITRGEDAADPKKYFRHLKERERLFRMHPAFVKRDSFYSPHLTQKELDGAVNTEYKKEIFSVTDHLSLKKSIAECSLSIICRMEYADVREGQACIRGFAYVDNWKHNNFNKTYVVLEGKEEILYVETQKVYNPTIAPQMKSRRNLNFVEFYTMFSGQRLQEKRYVLGVAVKPFAEKQGYIYMTDQIMEINELAGKTKNSVQIDR